MEFQLSYFKSWKMTLWKCCTQYASKFGKLSSGHRTGKGQFSFQSQRKAIPKNARTTTQLPLISHTSKVMLKILQARLQQYVNHELQIFKLVLEKAEEPEIKLPTSAGSQKKQESSRKTSISALLTTPKPSTVWITINCGQFFKRWEYQTTWPASWETCMQVRKQVRTGHGTTDWFQIGKGVRQGCILSSCLFNFYAEYIMRNAGAGRSTSWNQDCQEKYQ